MPNKLLPVDLVLYKKQRRLICRLSTGEIKSDLSEANKKILSGMEEHLFQVETALLEGTSATVTKADV